MANKKVKQNKISVGVGASNLKDAYKAAKAAAKQAMDDCGNIPTFSIVYVDSRYNPQQILKGINEVIGKNWVGCSVDKQISSKTSYSKDTVVSVLSIFSEYLHFGIGAIENYKSNAVRSGIKAIKEAMKDVKADRYVNSYVQFTRAKRQDYSTIIKTPPYFILAIAGSQTKKNGKYVAGEETKFLKGILEHTGPHIPVFGIGAGSDFDEFLSPKVKDVGNFQFAKGKTYKNAGIVVFVISSLYFEIDVQHGYLTTKDFVAVTKLDKTGFEILELNGKEPVAEYCRIVGASKEEYLKNPENYSLTRPLGLTALDGSTYIKEAFPNPDGKTLHCTYELKENMVLNVLKFNKESLFNTMSEIILDSKKNNKGKKIIMVLFCNCCSRRLLMEGEESKANQLVLKKHKDVPFFGCYAFSEIGSTKTNMAQVYGETVTALILYDNLLTEI